MKSFCTLLAVHWYKVRGTSQHNLVPTMFTFNNIIIFVTFIKSNIMHLVYNWSITANTTSHFLRNKRQSEEKLIVIFFMKKMLMKLKYWIKHILFVFLLLIYMFVGLFNEAVIMSLIWIKIVGLIVIWIKIFHMIYFCWKNRIEISLLQFVHICLLYVYILIKVSLDKNRKWKKIFREVGKG